MVGKKTVERVILATEYNKEILFVLDDLSLTLNDVEVTAKRNGSDVSNSSIVFNRQAIEQVQAFSIMDVLNNLPGKASVTPDLHHSQTLTLRGEAGGNYAMSNSLGVAIIIDGIRQSNDANMQNRAVSQWGMAGSTISGRVGGTSYDVPFTGLDLRDIPADNIESIEVVQGVAAAKYSEMTDGAVIINRQAGKTPYQANVAINAGSTKFSLSKGYLLDNNLGAVNISLGYLNSNEDPRDKIQSYNRINTGLMWTWKSKERFKNTVSLDYNTRSDDEKQDPDDAEQLVTYVKSRSVSISNRSSLDLKSAYVSNISTTFSYNRAYQDTYKQWLLNSLPKGIANKDTTGFYLGFYLPGRYLAVEQIIGEPENISASLSLSNTIYVGQASHSVNAGANFSSSANKGLGIVDNSDNPRWVNTGGTNERPYDYDKLVPAMINYGFYIQDSYKSKIFKKGLNINAGLRYDLSNGSSSIQPRLNANLELSKKWRLNAAYGISSKSPTLAHRYPAAIYTDLVIKDYYESYTSPSNLFLVYSEKILSDNSRLKPSKSTQFEIGSHFTSKWVTSSLFLYYKNNRNGFSNQQNFRTITLPEFQFIYTSGQPTTYYPTGGFVNYAGISDYNPSNGLSSDNKGAEFAIAIKKIPLIQTSFSLNTTFNYSDYKSVDQNIKAVEASFINAGREAWYGVYPPEEHKDWSSMSKLSSSTHIPRLGFIVTTSADIFWERQNKKPENRGYPIAYIDKNYVIHPITNFDPANIDYGYLTYNDSAESLTKQPFVYANINLQIAKEIRKKINIAINAYNVFNIRPSYLSYNSSEQTQTYTQLNSPLTITGGVSFKF
ncbi:TonB-dependent receptor [Arcticibacter svalbardensis MN12-7]|uniref:TonB-dependent receptor n=1 Tax=Arcticibacter svalbardensis MN12-7 TaxID=1150600 RepID=R9GWZ5_9SPHI|nr:TonB-dependent receptor [Arcticibacter svalbardensis MN12-7]